MKKTICVSPGCMGSVKLAIDLFGASRINPGSFGTPFWVNDLDDDEVSFAEEFFKEYDINVSVVNSTNQP